MTKAPISLQDLRRRIYTKAKAEKHWRFWGLYVHVCKMETLYEAYALAKANDGAPGIDGVTFKAIEYGGVEPFLLQIQEELRSRTYRPLRNRKKGIPKDGGKKVRVLSIPSIRDRVVQGALKLILEPIFGKFGGTWHGSEDVWVSAGNGGVRSFSIARWVSMMTTRYDITNSRKRCPVDRPHNPWREPDGRA